MTAETTGHDPNNSDALPNAEVIELFAPDLESLKPEDLSTSEIAELFASQWLHPSIRPSALAERIAADIQDDEDEWHQRLHRIVDTAPFFEMYDESLEDDTFLEIVTFLQKTKGHSNDLRFERKAAMALGELFTAIKSEDPEADTDFILKVFNKMPKTVTNQ